MSIVPQRPSVASPESPALLNELQSEVSAEAAPLLQFILKNAGLIVAVLVLLLIALAGTAGHSWYTARASQKAQSELARVMVGTQGPERLAALEKFLETAPSSIQTATLLALADAAMTQKNYDAAAKAYARIVSADPDGAMGMLAALNQGQALMQAGQGAQALNILEKLENTIPEAQRHIVRVAVAEAAVQAGNIAKAKAAFEALAAGTSGSEAEYFRFRARTAGAPAPAAPAGTAQ